MADEESPRATRSNDDDSAPNDASTDADALRNDDRVGAAPDGSGTTGADSRATPVDSARPGGAARDALYESIGVALLNAGIQQPASEFVADVRAAAGFRVAPRQVAAAVDEVSRAHQLVDVATVAELVKGLRGPAAERQRRHADDWRALGAALALRGLDGTPEGQRAFVGAARQAAGPLATDSLLLTVALTIAGEGRALLAPTVGAVARSIARSAPDLSSADVAQLTHRELRALDRPQRQLPPKRRSSSAARRPAPSGRQQSEVRTHKPGKRRWAPGGRRRRTIRFPEKRDE